MSPRPHASELTSNPSGRVDALDLLRLLAVAAVVLYHFGFNGLTSNGTTYVALPRLGPVAQYGYLGVQLFFVVSGFVIAFSAQGRTASEFFIARVARIYPAFLFCMTVTFLATLAFGGEVFHVTARQFLANLLIAAPAVAQPYVDLVYWTLILELTFYGWIFVLMLAGQMRKPPIAIIVVWLLVSVLNEVAIGSHVLTKIFLTDQSGFFAAGILLYALREGHRDATTQAVLGLAAATAILQSVLNARLMSAQLGVVFDPIIVAAVAGSIIVMAVFSVRARRTLLPASLAFAVGGMTYPLYLFHHQIGYVAFLRLDGGRHSVAVLAGILVALVVVALVIWRYVDVPGQRLMKTLLTKAAAGAGSGSLILRRKALFSLPK